MCGMTHLHVWHDSACDLRRTNSDKRIGSLKVRFLPKPGIHVCDMTYLYVWHDSFVYVTGPVHTCEMTHVFEVKYFWNLGSKTWLIHMCGMTHSYVRQDSFICGTWLIYIRNITPSTGVRRLKDEYVVAHSYIWVMSHINVTHMNECHAHDSFMRRKTPSRLLSCCLLFEFLGLVTPHMNPPPNPSNDVCSLSEIQISNNHFTHHFTYRSVQMYRISCGGLHIPGSNPPHKIMLYWFYKSSRLADSFPLNQNNWSGGILLYQLSTSFQSSPLWGWPLNILAWYLRSGGMEESCDIWGGYGQ